jgi:hypothetical protein
MPEKFQSLIIDLEVWFCLLLFVSEVPLFWHNNLLVLSSLSCFSLFIVVFLAIHYVVRVIFSFNAEKFHLFISSITIDSLLKTICVSKVFFYLLSKL